MVIAFGWGTVASFVGVGLSFQSIWAFAALLAPLIFCVLLVETITTAQLTKVGCAVCDFGHTCVVPVKCSWDMHQGLCILLGCSIAVRIGLVAKCQGGQLACTA